MGMNRYPIFGDDLALEALSQRGDRLVELDKHICWAGLVAVAEKTLAKSGIAFFNRYGAVAGVRRISQGSGGAD
jgi:hypothetical protein